MPVLDAEIIASPQVPTTLPTLEEVLDRDGITVEDAPQRLLQLSETPRETGHVFTLRAEREGMKMVALLEKLLAGWQAQGYTPVALEDCILNADIARLPRHNVIVGVTPGCIRPMALQGDEFLGQGALARPIQFRQD
jgi:hypothetical protein